MAEVKELVKKLANKHGRYRKDLLPILQAVVKEQSFLSGEAMRAIAEELDISSADVFGTASFFSFLNTKPKGKYIIRVCKSITCDMKGKDKLINTMEDMLKIKLGEITHGKRFSLLETNCIGMCNCGPAMLINDKVFTEIDLIKVREILGDYIRNKY